MNKQIVIQTRDSPVITYLDVNLLQYPLLLEKIKEPIDLYSTTVNNILDNLKAGLTPECSVQDAKKLGLLEQEEEDDKEYIDCRGNKVYIEHELCIQNMDYFQMLNKFNNLDKLIDISPFLFERILEYVKYGHFDNHPLFLHYLQYFSVKTWHEGHVIDSQKRWQFTYVPKKAHVFLSISKVEALAKYAHYQKLAGYDNFSVQLKDLEIYLEDHNGKHLVLEKEYSCLSEIKIPYYYIDEGGFYPFHPEYTYYISFNIVGTKDKKRFKNLLTSQIEESDFLLISGVEEPVLLPSFEIEHFQEFSPYNILVKKTKIIEYDLKDYEPFHIRPEEGPTFFRENWVKIKQSDKETGANVQWLQTGIESWIFRINVFGLGLLRGKISMTVSYHVRKVDYLED